MRGLGRSRELDRPARTAVSAVVVSVVALAGCGGDRVGAGASPSSATNSTGDGLVRFHDSETGVAGRYPDGWHRARALTNQVLPREVLTLATYPLRGGAKAGECAPDTARADMPPGGVFVWLLEYRPRARRRLRGFATRSVSAEAQSLPDSARAARSRLVLRRARLLDDVPCRRPALPAARRLRQRALRRPAERGGVDPRPPGIRSSACAAV